MEPITYRKLPILEDCIYNNYLEYIKKYQNSLSGIEQTKFALKRSIKSHTFDGFTRSSSVRNYLKQYFPDYNEYVNIILDKFIEDFLKIPINDSKKVPLYNAMAVTLNNHDKRSLINALRKVIDDNSLHPYESFSRYHNGNQNINYRNQLSHALSPDDICNIIIDTLIDPIIIERENQELQKHCQSLNDKINEKYSEQIQNFQVNPGAINRCKQDIQRGVQQSFKKADYSHGNLYASIDMGNKRQNQEDSVIIVSHPNIPDFKMMVVADGAGGMAEGEKVSSFITLNIMSWFEQLDSYYFDANNTQFLQEKFNRKITELSATIYENFKGRSSSTFVGAIINEKNTIISNVGDSRAYVYTGGQLHQLTDDDNVAYKLWQLGDIKQKDDIRFHKDSNRIIKGMGIRENIKPTSTIISNSDYDTLLLFSDGITDCLSDDQIKVITQNTKPSELARQLIESAKRNTSINVSLDPHYYNQKISAGKDNLSAVVFDNHSKEDEDGR